MKFLHKTQLSFYTFSKQQNSSIKMVTYRKMPVNKNIYLYFLFQKVKILMKRKIMLVTMATPISSHVKDKNSIFTARDEDMIF